MHNYVFNLYLPLLLVFCAPQDECGGTSLMIACKTNHLQIATFLIQKGANINGQAKVVNCYCFHINYIIVEIFPQSGFSSLHFASQEGHRAVVQLLIKSQAKLDIKNNVSVELLVACMYMGS